MKIATSDPLSRFVQNGLRLAEGYGDGFLALFGISLKLASWFGSDETIVERNWRLVHREDEDATDILLHTFCEERIGKASY